MFLGDIPGGTKVFIDANVFLNVALEEKHALTCSDFLRNVHSGELSGFVSLAVLDEVLFKLIQFEVSSKYRVPLRKVIGYIRNNHTCLTQLSKCWEAMENILSLNITVLDMPREFGEVIGNCKKYVLLTRDSLHVTTMEQNNIKDIATNDADFQRIDFLNVWKP